MKKVMIIDGGPRKKMNTAAMIEALTEGVKSKDEQIEVKLVRLYDIAYHGCMSCLACKLKNKENGLCSYKDGLTSVLEECQQADAMVFASPIYFFDVTGQMRTFIERLLFPWLSYDEYNAVHVPKKMPTAAIYTMNSTINHRDITDPIEERFESLIARFLQKPYRVEAQNTLQVKNYNRYAMSVFDVEDRMAWHQKHWPKELKHAFDVGVKMAEAI